MFNTFKCIIMETIKFWKVYPNKSLAKINFEEVLIAAEQLGYRLSNNDLVQIVKNRIYYRDENYFLNHLKSLINESKLRYENIAKDRFERDMLSQGKKLIKRLNLLDNSLILKDERMKSYKFFSNGYISITANDIVFFEYSTLGDYLIWDCKIVNRNWSFIVDKNCLYVEFINNSVKMSNYSKLIIGYLSHDFNEEGKGYLIVLTDQVEDIKEGGGTGKNVFSSLLKYTITTFDISAEQMKFDSSFMQSWQKQRLVIISDAGEKFNWYFLKNIVTGNTQYKKLYQDEIQIEFSDMPKFLISTNLSVPMKDGGINRRIRILEFTPFYKENIGVDVYHNGMFPEIWTDNDWIGYDTFIAECLQDYFKNSCQIDQIEISNTGDVKRFIQNYGEDMYDFINTNFNYMVEKQKFSTAEFDNLVKNYLRTNNSKDSFTNTKLNRAIEEYVKIYNKTHTETNFIVNYIKDKKEGNIRYKFFEKRKIFENLDLNHVWEHESVEDVQES
jgi:hypothetical protein